MLVLLIGFEFFNLILFFIGAVEHIKILTGPKTDFYSCDFDIAVMPAIEVYDGNSSYIYFVLQQFLDRFIVF